MCNLLINVFLKDVNTKFVSEMINVSLRDIKGQIYHKINFQNGHAN